MHQNKLNIKFPWLFFEVLAYDHPGIWTLLRVSMMALAAGEPWEEGEDCECIRQGCQWGVQACKGPSGSHLRILTSPTGTVRPLSSRRRGPVWGLAPQSHWVAFSLPPISCSCLIPLLSLNSHLVTQILYCWAECIQVSTLRSEPHAPCVWHSQEIQRIRSSQKKKKEQAHCKDASFGFCKSEPQVVWIRKMSHPKGQEL